MTNKVKRGVATAKKIGKAANTVLAKYPALGMIPYVPQAIQAANYAVEAADVFGELMESFAPSGGPTHSGAPYGQVAGVANTLTVRRSSPKLRGSRGVIRVTHKELLTTIRNSTTIDVQHAFTSGQSIFTVNAAASTTFPWLSSIASSYDYYRFKKIRLVYVPLCGTNTTGRVMLGYDPDSTDTIPPDRSSLSSYSCSSESSPWAVNTLDLKLSDTAKWYYNDNTSVGSSFTNTGALMDQGQIFAATWGGADSNPIGEIYVLYDVELKDPQPDAGHLAQSYGNGANCVASFPSNFPIFNATGTTSSVVMTCFTPGVYLITLQAVATNLGATTITNGDVLFDSRASTGTNINYISWIRVSGISTITFPSLTGLGKWTVWATRSVPQSTYVYT
jgi:hypothetical protein